MTEAHIWSPPSMPPWFAQQAQEVQARREWTVAWVLIAVFGTALSPFVLGDQRNMLVILASALALPTIIVLRLPMGADLGWSIAAIAYLIVIELAHGGTTNYSSLGYTGMFALAYLAFSGTLSGGAVTRERFIVLLRRLVQAYAAVSILQMVCAQAGLPVPNRILSKEAWSYNSLGVEPSHAARALAFTFLAYLILSRRNGPPPSIRQLWAHEKMTILAFTVSILLTGSSLAVGILPLTLVLALRLRWLLGAGLVLMVAWPFLLTIELDSIHRLVAFLTALPSMDMMAMVEADQSGAVRMMPLIIYLQAASLSDLSVWFGGGYEAIDFYVRGNLVGVGADVTMAGFVPGYVMICGLVGSTLFVHAYLTRFAGRQTWSFLLLWLLVLANSAWNSQVFWYGLLLLRAVHHFTQQPVRPLPVMGRLAR